MFNLENFSGGQLSEQINTEIEKVVNNIYDPNTDPNKVRKVVATISFKPNKKRTGAAVVVDVKSTLAPSFPTETNIAIDRDFNTGMVLATEIGNQIVGQVEMDIEEPAPKGCTHN
jgi:hypothetical protein